VPLSSVERRPLGRLIAVPRVASRVFCAGCALLAEPLRVMRLHSRERPAVAGELTGDRDRDDCAPFAAPLECVPAPVEPACALVGTRAYRGGLPLATLLERRACPQRSPLVPGRLDEQPARVRVAGLGDRAQAAPLAGRVLARGQAEEGAQRLRPEAGPVAELDREREGGQGREPRRQQSRPTISLNGGSAASSAIARSRASRRVFACRTAP
jgi:hypothetical protein